MRVDHFTTTDLCRAGPLFNPESRLRMMAREAMIFKGVLDKVMAKRAEIHAELTLARSHLKLRQRMLRNARIDMGINGTVARSLPRLLSPTHEADSKRVIHECGVEFCHALDRVWAAQRAVAMWDHVYGDLL